MNSNSPKAAVTPPDQEQTHADIPVLPPFIYAVALGLGVLFEILYGINFFTWGVQLALGVLLISFGAGLMTWCVSLFQKTGTPLNPHQPTREIITKGPYSLSRNPVYIAFNCIFLGICVLCDLFWGLFLIIPLIFIIQKFVIEKEEIYLENKFGQTYLAYKNNVKRWL